jgi:hypothetical protein
VVESIRFLVVIAFVWAIACADAPGDWPPQDIDPPAEVLEVTCRGGATIVQTPVVRVQIDGVHLRFDNEGARAEYSLHHESWAPGAAEGGPLAPGLSREGRSSIPPGHVLVACVTDLPGSYDDDGVHPDAVRIVDPEDLFVPFDLVCGWGEQFRVRIETDDLAPMAAFHRIDGVRSDDELVPPLYPESPRYGPTAIVFREGEAVARIMHFGTWGREEIAELLVNACPGSGISKGEAERLPREGDRVFGRRTR